MLLYAILYYFASSNLSIASPPSSSGSQFGNDVILSFAPRDADTVDTCPRTRLEIVWTCLATIFAASWVAVHPNMPGPNVSKLKKILLRVEIMLWAIITPELIVLWAMQQWRGAKVLENEFNSRFRKPNDAFKWTKKHGFFLQMGGFILCEEDKSTRILTWRILMQHYANGRVDLSEITEATIDDRSKADGFGKSIALIQTFWFIIQCIARFSDKHLALTELELATAALAVLGLLMYCFWWNKPFNAEVPIVINLHKHGHYQHLSIQTHGNDVLSIHTHAVSKSRASISAGIEFVRSNLLTRDSLKNLALIPFNALRHVLDCIIELVERYPPSVDFYSMKVPMFYYTEGVDYVANHRAIRNQIGSFLVAAVFGAIHCAGWSDKMIFHTRTGSLLWRISSVIITASPLLWILAGITYAANNAARGVLRKANDILWVITLSLSLFFVPSYIVARIILLILAFVELRYIPQGALNNIPWANVLPFIH